MREIDVLIAELKGPVVSEGVTQGVFQNVAYYTPRLRDTACLRLLVRALLATRHGNDVKLALDTTRAIFYAKLQISEPYLPVTQFYEVWDQEIQNCKNWNIHNLALLVGVLSTRQYFEGLQTHLFIDGKGIVLKFYENWRQKLFIPMWSQLLNNQGKTVHPPDESLLLIYSMVHVPGDTNDKRIPFDIVSARAIDIFIRYINNNSLYFSFWDQNLNQLAKILQISLPRTNTLVGNKILDQLERELNCLDMGNVSSNFYSNILLTTVLIFLPILENINHVNYSQMIKILYNINFIALDFGTVGFQTYEIVYEILCVAITKDIPKYMELMKIFFIELTNPLMITPFNKANDARLIFLLNFIEKTCVMIPTTILMEILPLHVEPCVVASLNSSNRDVREVAHSIMLQMLTIYDLSNVSLRKWQLQNIELYLDTAILQYRQGLMTDKQLIIIFRKISSCMESLAEFDMGRIILQKLYLAYVNTPPNQIESKLTILQCIMVQIPYINDRYLITWLENMTEMIGKLPSKDQMMEQLHLEITNSNRRSALRWWLKEGSRIHSVK